jgi:uncharacterized membrane protein YhaH (DUF805 family)
METLKRLFSIHGRMNRWKSFVWMVACSVLSGVISTIIELLSLPLPFSFPLNAPSMTAYVVLSGIVAVIGLIFSLTVVVRRLHDLGYSGWWAAAVYIITPLLILVLREIGAILSMVMLLAYCLILLFKRGTIGPNEYGPDPLAGEDEPVPVPEDPVHEEDKM